jgi:hypothetical protein
VDWFPWGDEAFTKARRENKPIFLSIGYSTCHWCHVMAHESFESDEVAAVLNEHFVSVKVDREERPDVDRVYMTFVQATTQSGGWPMSVWLTPDLKPFYGGTYFPPRAQWGRPGFTDILREIARVWAGETTKVQQSAEALTSELRRIGHSTQSGDVPGAESLSRTVEQFRTAFDWRNGGFGDAPKFPRPCELLFLFREWARAGNVEARDMALATLRAMALGGMRDHVGGGFHRYSVDAAWRVPHFEKMLYDQAQLALAFLEGYQVSGEAFYAEVAEDTLSYVMREMTDEESGGFFSAEDADSIPPERASDPQPHKAEGAFYLWRADEIDALLGDDAPIVRWRFGIEPSGNAPVDPHQEFTGKNLLYVAQSIEAIARQDARPPDDVIEVLNRSRVRMFQARLERPRPHLDDKVLTAWNGLMIAAFARMARIHRALNAVEAAATSPYLEAARRAASFIRNRMWDGANSTLLRRYRRGEARIEAYAEDYAYLVFGLLELFQADPDAAWLEWAETLQRRQNELFWDEADGGWFSTTGRDPTVLLRMKEDYDGAEPAAGSVSVANLLVLSHLIENPEWARHIERTFQYFGPRLEQMGRGVPMMAAALSAYHAGIRQLVVIGGGDGVASGGSAELERAAATRYLPFVVSLSLNDRQQRALSPRLRFVAAMKPVDSVATAYVCRDFSCRAPVTSVADLRRELS